MSFNFSGIQLFKACQNTFKRRKTVLSSHPYVFTEEFAADEQKTIQWNAFIKKAKPVFDCKDFRETMTEIKQLLLPIFECIHKKEEFDKTWSKEKQQWL